jgi:tetratricopeptide (TPR) repeat protein
LKTNPNDVDALIYRGQIQIRSGHPNDATETLESAIKDDPDNGVAHYHLGVAFDQLGNLARAEGEWRNAVRLKPELVEAQRALAAVALRRNDMGGLEEAAGQIIKLLPSSPDGFALRAVSYINRGQFDRAEQDARKSIEVAPQSPVGYIQMGNLRLAQKQYNEAEKAYQQGLEHDPTSADSLAGLMNTYLSQKQTDKAIAAANAQIGKVPNSSAFYDLLGTILFNQKKDMNGAEAALKKSCELDKNNADALLKLGQVQVAKGSTEEAIATYQNSLKDNPREVSLYILMGELYESKQDWEHAKDAYQKALNLAPDNPVASNNLAYVILQTGGNVDLALSLAQTARRGMPDSPNAADTLGWVFYQKGAYKPAIDLFEEAIKLAEKNKSPENPTFHYHLGLAYDKNDQPALARQHLERVLKINPNYSSAGDVRALLSQLRS